MKEKEHFSASTLLESLFPSIPFYECSRTNGKNGSEKSEMEREEREREERETVIFSNQV